MSKKYQIDRRQLVLACLDKFEIGLLGQKLSEDIVSGGEFIITAEEVLAIRLLIPGRYLVGFDPLTFPSFVDPKDCEIVYIQSP